MMANIVYKDTDGNKDALLPKGNLGYDDYEDGGDRGRVYVGTGDENIPLATKAEADAAVLKDTYDANTMLIATEDNTPEAKSPTDVRTFLNIEDGATADQTDTEIKVAYENNDNTNAYVDADKVKVDHITIDNDLNLDTMRADLDNTIATKVDKYNHINKNADYTAIDNDFIYCDTSDGEFTITLPDSPDDNAVVAILDATSSFKDHNLTIARNGNNIMGQDEDMTIGTKNVSIVLKYNGNNDWRLI